MLNVDKKLLKDVKNKKINNIVILVGGGIGNIITFIPAIKKLKKELPNANITLLGDNIALAKDILETYPYNLNMIELSRKLSLYKLIKTLLFIRSSKIDLFILPMWKTDNVRIQKSIKSASIFAYLSGAKYILGNAQSSVSYLYNVKIMPYKENIIDLNLSSLEKLGFDITEEDKKPELFFNFTDSGKKIRDMLVKETLFPKSYPLVIFHTGTGKHFYNRQWLNERWAELGDILIDKYKVCILFIGDNQDLIKIKEIQGLMNNKTYNFAGRLSLTETAGLIKMCNLIICTNSGPMHIAASLEVPSVVLIGPTPKEWWPTYNHNAYIVYKNTCKIFCEGYCNLNKNICMESITVEDVVKGVDKQLKNIKN
ncbi:MAG: glycosyltransferase family 9 protein [bacterium]|nr:glycosyltransferase family 9 protein [bacterium]